MKLIIILMNKKIIMNLANNLLKIKKTKEDDDEANK